MHLRLLANGNSLRESVVLPELGQYHCCLLHLHTACLYTRTNAEHHVHAKDIQSYDMVLMFATMHSNRSYVM